MEVYKSYENLTCASPHSLSKYIWRDYDILQSLYTEMIFYCLLIFLPFYLSIVWEDNEEIQKKSKCESNRLYPIKLIIEIYITRFFREGT